VDEVEWLTTKVEGRTMSLNIKSERVHGLAREAARRTGHSQTKVVEEALELLLRQLEIASGSQRALALELLDDFDRRMTPADRRHLTTDDLYDKDGLPA